MKCGVLSKECEYVLKRVSFGSKECTFLKKDGYNFLSLLQAIQSKLGRS